MPKENRSSNSHRRVTWVTERACYVVPCHNEASRLDEDGFVSVIDQEPLIDLLFVNDGSTDDTRARLEALTERRPGRIHALSLEKNMGKAEAVRRGLLEALKSPVAIVGYFDAESRDAPSEMRRLLTVMQATGADLLLGSRVAMLGRDIHRSMVRHYLGRAFATAASIVLDLRVYDTQCGAKLIRRSAALLEALDEPFTSRWVFDVEFDRASARDPSAARSHLDHRRAAARVARCSGSKVRPAHFLTAATNLARIGWSLRSRKRRD